MKKLVVFLSVIILLGLIVINTWAVVFEGDKCIKGVIFNVKDNPPRETTLTNPELVDELVKFEQNKRDKARDLQRDLQRLFYAYESNDNRYMVYRYTIYGVDNIEILSQALVEEYIKKGVL